MLRCSCRRWAATAPVHIPDRLTEGYGPSQNARWQQLKAQGAQLLVTLDCGVMAHDPLARAAELGLDHHHRRSPPGGPTLPQAHAVINPNRQDDVSGLGYLCAAGVTMIFIAAVNKALRQQGLVWRGAPRAQHAAVAGARGTRHRLRRGAAQGPEPRLCHARPQDHGAAREPRALLRWPMWRASSASPILMRWASAGPAHQCGGPRRQCRRWRWTCSRRRTSGEAAQLAQELDGSTASARRSNSRVVDQAMAQADTCWARSGAAACSSSARKGWHPGVVGLAAARLKERFNLPSFVLAEDKTGRLAAGSGRSIPGVDSGSAVREALESGLIEKGGGHAMAAGLTVRRSGWAISAPSSRSGWRARSRRPRQTGAVDRCRTHGGGADAGADRAAGAGGPLWHGPSLARLRLSGAPRALCRSRRAATTSAARWPPPTASA